MIARKALDRMVRKLTILNIVISQVMYLILLLGRDELVADD